jgi:hypothetical protein
LEGIIYVGYWSRLKLLLYKICEVAAAFFKIGLLIASWGIDDHDQVVLLSQLDYTSFGPYCGVIDDCCMFPSLLTLFTVIRFDQNLPSNYFLFNERICFGRTSSHIGWVLSNLLHGTQGI